MLNKFQHLTTVPHLCLRLNNIHDIIQLCQAATKKQIRLYQGVSPSKALTYQELLIVVPVPTYLEKAKLQKIDKPQSSKIKV